MTPLILEARRVTRAGLEGWVLERRTAVECTRVDMGVRPAARMVSPDSGGEGECELVDGSVFGGGGRKGEGSGKGFGEWGNGLKGVGVCGDGKGEGDQRKEEEQGRRTDQIHDPIRTPQRAGNLHATTHVINLCSQFPSTRLCAVFFRCAASTSTTSHCLSLNPLLFSLQSSEIPLSQPLETRHDLLPHQLSRLRDTPSLGDLHLQLTLPELEIHHHLHFPPLAYDDPLAMISKLLIPSRSLRLSFYTSVAVSRRRFILEHLVPPCDPQIYAALGDEPWDISCAEEDERDGVIYGKGDVEARGAVELDVGAFEEFEGGFIEAAFCGEVSVY